MPQGQVPAYEGTTSAESATSPRLQGRGSASWADSRTERRLAHPWREGDERDSLAMNTDALMKARHTGNVAPT